MARNKPEDRLQTMVVKLLEHTAKPGLFWFHCPNGGKMSPQRGAYLKAMGVVAGVPDLVMCWQGRFIGIELKAGKNKQSDNQLAADLAIRMSGGMYRVCTGYEETVEFLTMIGVINVALDKRFKPRERNDELRDDRAITGGASDL